MASDTHTIRAAGEYELEIRRSRFICALDRASTEEEAQAFIEQRRRAHREATHNCTAYVVDGGRLTRSNDDGEPAGTAGTPMLDALLRRDVTDVVAVVTRYFGGVKLGAAGLTRAYRQAVNVAIDQVGLVTRRSAITITVEVEHTHAGRLSNDLHASGYVTIATRYGARAEFDVLVAVDDLDAFDSWIADVTAGQAATRRGEAGFLEADA